MLPETGIFCIALKKSSENRLLGIGLRLSLIPGRSGLEKVAQIRAQEEKFGLKKSCDNSPSLDGTQAHEDQQH